MSNMSPTIAEAAAHRLLDSDLSRAECRDLSRMGKTLHEHSAFALSGAVIESALPEGYRSAGMIAAVRRELVSVVRDHWQSRAHSSRPF
jgi:hypothetical protein